MTATVKSFRTEQIIDQMGKRGFNSAFAYVGASNIFYRDNCPDRTPDASEVLEGGFLRYAVGIVFDVNGKPKSWKMIVALEPDDTYTVRLWEGYSARKMAKTGHVGHVLSEASGVYCDNLKDVVESMYDEAVKKYNGGWIRI